MSHYIPRQFFPINSIAIAPAIQPSQPSRDRVQIAPRISGDIVQPFGVNISSAEMVQARKLELAK